MPTASLRPLGLVVAALLGAASALKPLGADCEYQECQRLPVGHIWPGKAATVAAVTGALITRHYICGEDGFSSDTTFYSTEDPRAEDAQPIGAMRVDDDKDSERLVEWFEPGQPDKPTGSLVILQDTAVYRENKCYAEPDSTRKTVKTEGVAKGIAFVGKRATEGETEKDCTGKSDGDKVDATYVAFYLWFGCSNDPYEDPAPDGPLDPERYHECEPLPEGSVFPNQGSTGVEMVGANVTRYYTCGEQGSDPSYNSFTRFYDLSDPTIQLATMVVEYPTQDERVVNFHAPGNPDEPLGSVTMLHSTQVENQKKATQACFTEPNSVRQTKNDGTGVLKDVRFVLKRATEGFATIDKDTCRGKKPGEKVETVYRSAYYFGACTNDPFKDAK